jgi:serine/threonine protein kinase/DNA-binding winged helix-turn-helix (wHTH) protein
MNDAARGGEAARRWQFGPAVLDERTLELSVKGEIVSLERKPLEVLLFLLNHAGEVVTKDEILDAVWPGRILTESVLTKCIAKIREAVGDEQSDIIKTQHGYGYRLVAEVKVETSLAPARARFDFKPGEHLPARPLWGLVERLGTGGHGEAWLARHDKTHERRVYKFAADTNTLVALKREITIYRLLHDSLGERPDLVHLLDWNLQEPPYFVEYDYVEKGSLSGWANAQGGIDRVPMEVRLEIAAQVAEAIAAAHSVGVLHKDLKPSNVLVESADLGSSAPRVQIKLCDFGSGGVLDVERLEQMGITRLGFTQTAHALGDTSGTPLYLAPEVVAGQPFTVQADVYALGVMLYQLVAGNFNKSLSPGWEHDIADELLREDIAQAADGHAERRITDASRLAQRLRTLDARRRQRTAERAEKAAADQARLEIERMRARRTWVRLAITSLFAGLTVSALLYVDARRSRDAAREAAATSRTVTSFLSQDMFALIDLEQRPVRDVTLMEVLLNAGRQIEPRFSGKPEIAAELHAALGGAFYSLSQAREAEGHLDRALVLFDQQYGPGSESALQTAVVTVELKNSLGELPQAIAGLESMLDQGALRLGADHPRVLALRMRIAQGYHWLGEWRHAVQQFQTLLATLSQATPRDNDLVGRTQHLLGSDLVLLGQLKEGEKALRDAYSTLVAAHGADHLAVSDVRRNLGEALTEQGRYDEADAELSAALQVARKWVGDETGNVLSIRLFQASLRLEQSRDEDAVLLLRGAVDTLAKVQAKDQTMWFRERLAEAYQRRNQLKDAEAEMSLAVRIGEQSLASHHPVVDRFRIGLADILCDERKYDDAWTLLKSVNGAALIAMSPQHPYIGRLRRVEGRLWLARGEYEKARIAWMEAHRIYGSIYGAEHRRTRSMTQDLAHLPAAQASR